MVNYGTVWRKLHAAQNDVTRKDSHKLKKMIHNASLDKQFSAMYKVFKSLGGFVNFSMRQFFNKDFVDK